ncbi:Sm-like ribonucleoprotein [Pseudovirgaria hyperparasitica]|uniref:LSM complex subunit LSM4 n=1 Tax=Pseudovirgaria hyperparasitica TaxID=470096 RepID=A0A6A6WHG6_9PEZI|nr:Sm-like ribonucleoprotein [Pseudovirgaria hyperparasitica]KAF2762238.1 Sm-like ribonucleoprotein [Pseudovirgaria hyperparasitica]
MLPLGLLNAAKGRSVLVELKDGESLTGHLEACDTWMNLTLKEVVSTSKDGETFFRLPEAYVRGNTIKFLRVEDSIMDDLKKIQAAEQAQRSTRGGAGHRGGHGDRGDRGRGMGRGGRGGRGRGRGA